MVKSKPKIAVLTTTSSHHVHFVNMLAKHYTIVQIIVESRETTMPFAIQGRLDEKVEAYERELWFNNAPVAFDSSLPIYSIASSNDADSIKRLKQAKPDIIIAFGVGRLSAQLLNIAPKSVLYIQATDTERYYGLDTIYWAASHGDFASMAACINLQDEKKKQGHKIFQYYYTPAQGSSIYALRSFFTKRALDACQDAIAMYCHFGQFISQPQNYEGRFYSFMPAVLKDRLEEKFDGYLDHYWLEESPNIRHHSKKS